MPSQLFCISRLKQPGPTPRSASHRAERSPRTSEEGDSRLSGEAVPRVGSSRQSGTWPVILCAARCRVSWAIRVGIPDGDLNDTRLDFYDALATMDPLVVNLHAALPETRNLANAVDTLVALIRSYGAIGACDLNLPKNARTGACCVASCAVYTPCERRSHPLLCRQRYALWRPSVNSARSAGDLRTASRKLPCLARTTGSILLTDRPCISPPRSHRCLSRCARSDQTFGILSNWRGRRT
jgi:hypothetical protein